MATLNELIGSYDNLDEPIPWMNHKSSIYGLVISSLTITTICVLLRLHVRFFVTRTPGYDDYLIIATFITAWAANVGCCLLANNGLGQHFVLLGLTGMADFTRMFWWCNAVYNMTLALVKLSLLAQYLRLLDEHPGAPRRPRLRAAVVALAAVVAAWGAVWTVLAWVPCAPVQADWDFAPSPGVVRWGYGSRDPAVFVATFYNHAAANMVLDVLVLSLPLLSRSLWATAAASRRSHLGVLALFALGALSVACSVVRLVYMVRTRATTHPTFDPTWYGTYSTVLSAVEADLATVAASLPVFWPHLRRGVASILVTREVEVRVARKSDFFALAGAGAGGGPRRHTRNVGAHWDLEVGGGDGHRLSDRDGDGEDGAKDGGVDVMMRDLGFGGPRRVGDGVAPAETTRPQRAGARSKPASSESMKEMLLN